MENGNRSIIEVWMWRHGDNEGGEDGTYWGPKSVLSQEGRKVIQRVIEANLAKVKFKILGCSGLVRAKQTIQMYANGKPVEVLKGLGPASPAAWDLLDKRDPKLASSGIIELYQNLAGAVILTAEAEQLLNTIKDIAAKLDYGEKALLVSHEPLINAALNMAKKDWSSKISLQKGEIIIFRFDRDLNFVEYEHIPLP